MRELLSKLWFKVILGMISGIALGLALSPSAFALIPSEAAFKLAPWVALIVNVFFALIKSKLLSYDVQNRYQRKF